ncbi:2-hydroxyhepta-2,4-diene-1,7-dioate isomerase [Paenibacillus marchantiophytorum]|uniref:2-hydroxyhepta-2,4-diene-1,7-dioate isomerase n=1 Tax=Paenibacillus marchantiophytorum TaxID=1619310 RepID=A0ABQ1ENL0_9BACL|nr:fumarylacetoacetate hydrolase family protein [Paenibacillus marchantiophytorum]GFZ80033.1 2-hydroxyhepta-2,4-diene-1,7-dioate isomerase [Paenibacillus marchantiophytorum]
MKLLTFMLDGTYRLGVKKEQGVLDVLAALSAVPSEKAIPTTIQEVIAGGAGALNDLRNYTNQVVASVNDKTAYVREESTLDLGPCVTHPNKIICVGLNYRRHAEETGAPIPQYPILFNKFNNTITGHGDDIPLPKVSEKVDYEAELAIVIGRTAKSISKDEALDYVLGYCNANDLSARDLQVRTQQWLLGKSCDKFAPIGPYLVTADEIANPNDLEIKTYVNGEVRQQSNTSDMIFHCDEIVSYISQHMTLVPGDIILTGTPEGVVLGYPPDKQVYLKDGDIVSIEIEKLGTLTNRMVSES